MQQVVTAIENHWSHRNEFGTFCLSGYCSSNFCIMNSWKLTDFSMMVTLFPWLKKMLSKSGIERKTLSTKEQSNITDNAQYLHRAQRITQCESASQNGQELHAGFIHHRIKSRCSGSFFRASPKKWSCSQTHNRFLQKMFMFRKVQNTVTRDLVTRGQGVIIMIFGTYRKNNKAWPTLNFVEKYALHHTVKTANPPPNLGKWWGPQGTRRFALGKG